MLLRLGRLMQQEVLLVITFILAAASSFIVAPSLEYLDYIDWNTLALLLALMIVMAGLKSLGLFSKLGKLLLAMVMSERALEAVLVLTCFFSSMIITNDVALIVFVPFAIETLNMSGMKKNTIFVVVLQTIAANLGSMVTPIGNPQNIYLYFKSGFSVMEFLGVTFPYAVVSLALLIVFIYVKKNSPIELDRIADVSGIKSVEDGRSITKAMALVETREDKAKLSVYGVMFALCLLSLSRMFPVCVLAVAIAALTIIIDRRILKQVDYSLLLTFVNFFIFVGNMQHIPVLSEAVFTMVSGNETMAAIGISQIISNVPAVLLLTGFTQSWKLLIVGSNLGGLGTMVASMASLISFKYIVREHPQQKVRYMIAFTVANVIFLGANLLVMMVI